MGVELVNRILRTDLGYPQLVSREEGWSLARVTPGGDPLAALVPVARSAAELIGEAAGTRASHCNRTAIRTL